ncbi:SusC/RagA family TonB-linked outer membrane protein [Chryseobacterium phosphatilyticum]|uniref:SusC/RagA family TonB-linked outer membrane protein n=1 Tax=Chryseobacterium phosphatilyticum TaxID=475075 RepID=A0A316X8A1_9FLAO|nr:SusC/RagA family TonB-linked outer membrane protein [Chryseobacterium phosphatilyticum]PWN70061.1 SusC/RagA family TonB-linked outer membrane protein [Chryseobacterium phosphatilyticum]
MKKLTTSLLVLMLTSSVAIANAQEKKNDTVKTKEIEGVVVTALGIKREKRSLGYATQEVKGEAVNKNPTTNFLNNLSGKVAGLEIKQSTNFGGSINVVTRGYKSILGDNQALFVVDGVPVMNKNINSTNQTNGAGGYDYGSSVSDINPNDIETINVLKGAAATALYGARAQNGAVIITTKRGKKNKEGIGMEFSSSITVSSVDKSTFPTYQSQYGQGYGGSSFPGTYQGSPIVGFGNDASYGSAYDGSMVWQYGAFIPGSPTEGKLTPWKMAENGPITFFEKATNYVNSISFSGGNDVATYRFGYTNTNATDIMPNSELIKNNFTGNASYKLTDKLTANFYASYITQKTTGRNTTGYNDNIMTNFRQWWPTNVDIKDLQNLYKMSGKNYTWNMRSRTDLRPAFWDNPYFQRYENYQNDSKDRFAGNFSLSYDVSKDINLLFRAGRDTYTMMVEERKAVGSYTGNTFGLNVVNQPSGYALSEYKFSETNYDFIGTYKKNITDDFNVNALLGGNINVQRDYSNQQSTSGGLSVAGLYTIANSASSPARPIISDLSKYIYGVFGQVSLGYKNTYYLEGTYRRDQTTALSAGNNVYWYPSVSASVVFSNLIQQNWLNFGKIRAAYAEVGSDTGADRLRNRYQSQPSFGDVLVNAYNAILRNPELTSQSLKNIEFGIEARLFNNRLGFDVSWFQNKGFQQILPLPVSLANGVTAKFANAGELTTRGFEVSVNATPIKTDNFSWDLNLNWSNPWTKVTSLNPGIENITIGALQGGVSINAPLNGDYGSIWTSDYVYDSNGQRIVGPNGAYLVTDKAIYDQGSFQARWTAGLNNTINYKNLSLSFLIDWRQGGKVYSLDQFYGYGTGLYPDSVGFNDLGNPIRNTLANGGGVIMPGVMVDPNNPGHYIPNTIRLDKSQSSQVLQTDLPGAAYIYDASFVKLREVAITYRFDKKIFNSKFIQGMSMSLIGNNLWIIHKNLPYADPEAGLSSGNIQGYQSGVMPGTRNISFNVKINF